MNDMNISKKFITALFALSVIVGVGGIHGLGLWMTSNYASTPEGQSLLALPLEVATNILAFAFVMVALKWQLRANRNDVEASIKRKLDRITVQVAELLDRADELDKNPLHPTRFIWKRSAWDSAKEYFAEHMTEPGLLYVLDDFFMAADSIREADWDRFKYLLTENCDPDKAPSIVSAHIANLRTSGKTLCNALAEQGYYIPGRRAAATK